MKTPLSTTMVPAAPATEPSGMTFEEHNWLFLSESRDG